MNCTRREFTRTAGVTAIGGLFGFPLFASNTSYTVKTGDTLGHIALRLGVSTSELRQANQLSGDLIRVGQKLRLPANPANPANSGPGTAGTAATIHIVQRGDTLGGIALAHGIRVSDLKRANELSSDVIRIGQKLNVPTSAIASEDLLGPVRAATARINVRTDNWKRIVVHHSAIKYGNAAVYDRAHRRRNMPNGLAYHFVIGNGINSRDGEIEIGPRWTEQLLGGHVKSYRINLTAIGICLVGNFQEGHPTRRQLQAFTQLMDWLRGEVVPRATQFAGHRDLRGEQTICPGKNFPLAAMHARYS